MYDITRLFFLIFLTLCEMWFYIFQVCHIYLVRHEGGEGATNLVIVHVGLTGAEQDKNKADRDGDLQHRLQKDRLI